MFAGWRVVAGVFVMLVVACGTTFYGLTVYLDALVEQRGFSVSATSGATAAFFVAVGVSGVVVASQLERRDPRPVVAVGALLGAVSLLMLGRVTEAWQVYPVYVLMGVGFCATSLVPGTTLVSRWFARRRAAALSIASSGLSAGGVVVTPFVAGAVGDRGLEATAPWLALAYLVGIVPVTALLLRARPSDLGLRPDGDPAPSPAASSTGAVPAAAPAGPSPAARSAGEAAVPELPPVDGVALAEAVRSRYFVVVTVSHSFGMLAQVGAIAHVFRLVAERQDAATAATAVSVLAFSSLVGRVVAGVLGSRVGLRGLQAALLLTQTAALVSLALLDGRAGLLVAAGLFGLTVGNVLLLHPLLLAARFGLRDYARVYSRSQLLSTVGIAAGPALLGLLHDYAGGYVTAYVVAGREQRPSRRRSCAWRVRPCRWCRRRPSRRPLAPRASRRPDPLPLRRAPRGLQLRRSPRGARHPGGRRAAEGLRSTRHPCTARRVRPWRRTGPEQHARPGPQDRHPVAQAPAHVVRLTVVAEALGFGVVRLTPGPPERTGRGHQALRQQ